MTSKTMTSWHTLVFDGVHWGKTEQTFEEWMDEEQVAFPPSWDSFAFYCRTYYEAMPASVRDGLWKQYSQRGFACVNEQGTVIQRFEPDGTPI